MFSHILYYYLCIVMPSPIKFYKAVYLKLDGSYSASSAANSYRYEKSQFKKGSILETSKPPEVCKVGIHYCDTIADCLRFIELEQGIVCVFEVFPEGTVSTKADDPRKFATDKLRIGKKVAQFKQYDGCGYFSEGRAGVRKEGESFYIDLNGKRI